jgi:hypothetical protein
MLRSQTEPVEKKKKRKRSGLWNVLTVLTLLATAVLFYYFLSLYRNPRIFLNPFPPEPSPTVFFTVTPTITPIQQPPTWTPSVTIEPTASRTKAPTWTIIAALISQTATMTPSITPTPTITRTPMPASAEIAYLPSTQIYPAKLCAWMGVGGTVVDLEGKPLLFYQVLLGGELDGVVVNQTPQLSGSALDYGESGFEFQLSDHPIASSQTLWIQLFDNSNKALTEKIYFDTFDDCQKNLVKITFTRIR